MSNLSKVFSAELEGIEAKPIEVETDVNVGLHSFAIVGLADKALSEAKERVNSALKNSGAKPPNRDNRKIVVNLAPADVKKTGSHYDCAIAIAFLLATEQLKKFNTADKMFIGELALDGRLRPVAGALNIALSAKRAGYKYLFVPKENAVEAALIEGIKVVPVENLVQLMAILEQRSALPVQPVTKIEILKNETAFDISDIKGQASAKRALLIAAAGGHNILMSGSPGAGKTMLAQALISLLPPLSIQEVLEITSIYSAAGMLGGKSYIKERPFRAPHHSASLAAVIGGGQNPRPGEVSLAHRGVLFLDELPEFRRDVLESLRQPLESGEVHISRARAMLSLPARFLLVSAMNPCPCGYKDDPERECKCPPHLADRYTKKVSGPLLDRIDLQIEVPRVEPGALLSKNRNKSEGDEARKKVLLAREMQKQRLFKYNLTTNAEMSSKECDNLISFTTSAEQFIKDFLPKASLSARGYYKVLKVARTIADLEGEEKVNDTHIQEAFSYRLREIE